MHQGKQHGAYGGYPGPAVLYKQGFQGVEVGHLHQGTLGHISHDDDGDYNFIGGQAEDKGQQDDAVQPQQFCKGVQESGTMGQQSGVPQLNVRHNPDDEPGRSGYRRGSAQNKKGAVKDGTHDHLPHLRRPVGRKLQREGRGDALQNGFRKQLGYGKGHQHAENNHGDQQHGGEYRSAEASGSAYEEHGDDGDERGKCATIQTATLLHTTSRWLTVPYSPSIKIWRSFPSQTIFLTISLIKVRFSSIVSV